MDYESLRWFLEPSAGQNNKGRSPAGLEPQSEACLAPQEPCPSTPLPTTPKQSREDKLSNDFMATFTILHKLTERMH